MSTKLENIATQPAHLIRCPPELISLIGEYLERNSYHLVSFSQVCRKTRNTIIRDPALWSLIKVENYPHRPTPSDMFYTFLERAHDSLLDVEISLASQRSPDTPSNTESPTLHPQLSPEIRAMLDRLYARASHWRTLTINEHDSSVMVARHLFDRIQTFPRLVRLNLVACKYNEEWSTRPLLAESTPALTWLDFRRTSPLYFIDLLPNVSVLVLDDADRFQHRFVSVNGLDQEFMHTLNLAQSLTTLRLHEQVMKNLELVETPLVVIPVLEHLVLVGRSVPEFFMNCLSNISPPSLQSLSVYYISTYISARTIPSLDLDDLPNIEDYSFVTSLSVLNVELKSVGDLDIRHYVTGGWRWDSPCMSFDFAQPDLFPNLESIVVLNRSDNELLSFCRRRELLGIDYDFDIYFPRKFVKADNFDTRQCLKQLSEFAFVKTFALPDLSTETVYAALFLYDY
jgi:hypothetical protein